MNLFRKTLISIYFISEERIHYINTPKQLILDFYNCINDNFNVKIVIVLLLFFLAQKINCGYIHNLFLSKKRGKGCFSLSETQFYYKKVGYKVVKITRA